MSKFNSVTPPSERILNVARELFYTQGFRATGINEVIEKSGVAKATFYHHYPTKEALGQAYLKAARDEGQRHMIDLLTQRQAPFEQFMAVIESLGVWRDASQYRGCTFFNIAGEIPDADSPLRLEGKSLYDDIRKQVHALSQALVDSDPQRYGHLNVERLTEDYMINLAGAAALTSLYEEFWPIDQAVAAIRRLVGH